MNEGPEIRFSKYRPRQLHVYPDLDTTHRLLRSFAMAGAHSPFAVTTAACIRPPIAQARHINPSART